MTQRTEYQTLETAVQAAYTETFAPFWERSSDCVNLKATGYFQNGLPAFRIYKSFTAELKPCFYVSYCSID